MRLSRWYSLPAQSVFHLMWRAINGEMFLKEDGVKRLPEKAEADRNHAMGSPRFVARRTLFLRQASLILAGSPRAFPRRAGVDPSRGEMTRSKLNELLSIEFSLAAGHSAGLGAGQMGACGGAAESQAPPMP